MTEFSEIERQTKAVYVEQHKAYLRDPSIFERFYRVAADPKSYDLPSDFFRGKKVADVGCGNTAYFQKAMFDLGAGHVVCIDIGTDWMPELQSALDGLGVPRSFYTMLSGSAVDLPLDDSAFDFVASNGVLMHLENVELAERAFAEHARVTRSGGFFYAYFANSRGLIDAYILPAVRSAYREQPAFRAYIDGLTPDRLQSDLEGILAVAAQHDPDIVPALRSAFSLLTLDTITFWQNCLQVPVQLGAALDEDWVRAQFDRHGFSNVRHCPPVYWHRNDIRRFMAPIHFASGLNAVATLLNGGGHLKMIGEKLPHR